MKDRTHIVVENIFRMVTEHCEYTLYPNPDTECGWEGGGYLRLTDVGVDDPETREIFLEPEVLWALHRALGRAADEAGA